MADTERAGRAGGEASAPGDLVIAKQGHFYVGGHYHETKGIVTLNALTSITSSV